MSAPHLSDDATYRGATFTGALLPDGTLQDASFVDCTFLDADLRGAELEGCSFTRCRFERCNLSNARLEDCGLSDVRFDACKLMGIDWSACGLIFDASWEGCVLDYGSFAGRKLRAKHFVACSLLEVDFTRADLQGTVFQDCRLGGAQFPGAQLRGADLSSSTGVFVDPARSRVKATRIDLAAAVSLAEYLGFEVVGYGGA